MKINFQSVNSLKRLLFILVLASSFSAVFVMSSPLATQADPGVGGHVFNATFTKWLTTYPNMVGIVGGDVGNGSFKGEILSYNDDGTTTLIHALYHMYGSVHSFSADVHVTESDANGAATLTGVVTEGWLAGAQVTGAFQTLKSCSAHPSGPCFQGAVQLYAGSQGQ
ncbi:MAG TPA: hypothetical protein VGK87_01275 [Anaerolineae bacterium]